MKQLNKTLGILLLIIPFLNSIAQEKNERPNILYIMSDDHAANAIGVYGSRLASLNPTPNIDNLANGGIIFENCFVNNSICTPSRASILTGQFPQTNGVLDLEGPPREFNPMPREKQYLPIEMKKMGYETAMVGKWHLENEPAAFDYYCVFPGQGSYFNPTFRVRGTKEWKKNTIQKDGHSSDVVTDVTLDWLKSGRDKSKPFFLMHHFKAPHDMYQFAPRYESYLEDVEIPEPSSLYFDCNHGSEATRGKNDSLVHFIGSSIGRRNIYRNLGGVLLESKRYNKPGAQIEAQNEWNAKTIAENRDYTHRSYQEYLKRYLRCVKGIDDNVKRIVDYLKETGELENTIIVYTSDQGQLLGEHDYQDKRWMYEESLRMPFIMHFPKNIVKGKRTDAIINNADFAPTLLELAGGEVPEYMQGNSFKEIVKSGNEPKGWQQAIYYRYWMHMAHKHHVPAHFGIRTKRYKLIFFYGTDYMKRAYPEVTWVNTDNGPAGKISTPPGWEFYDLEKDPKELDNRYENEKYQGVITDLKKQLKELRVKLNETDKDYPAIQKIIDENWDK